MRLLKKWCSWKRKTFLMAIIWSAIETPLCATTEPSVNDLNLEGELLTAKPKHDWFWKAHLGGIPFRWDRCKIMIWFSIQEDANNCYFWQKTHSCSYGGVLSTYPLPHLSNWCSMEPFVSFVKLLFCGTLYCKMLRFGLQHFFPLLMYV